MRLLFIKLKHIGDALLLTPTLQATRARHPSAEIWVVVRKGTESILDGCLAVDRIVVSSAPEATRRSSSDGLTALRNLRLLRQQNFDWAFELSDGDRRRWMTWLSGAKQTAATGCNVKVDWLARRAIDHFVSWDWKDQHRVEKDYRTAMSFLDLPGEIPGLVFDRSRCKSWAPGEALERFVVMHPGTRWLRKRWPIDRWVQLGRELVSDGRNLVVSAGPDAEERTQAARIIEAVGPRAISTAGGANWAQLAGLLYRADLFVGVDTAAMHLAAACGCPTVAIFGPSIVSNWRPWRVPHEVMRGGECVAESGQASEITDVPVDRVRAACESLGRQRG